MAYNKIGFHAAVPGNLNGWGDYVRALDAAGIPAVVMSVGGGGIGDILAEWDSGSTVPHVVGVRYMPPDGSQDVPPYGSDARQAAVDWWGWLYPRIGNDVKAHKDKCWIVTGNELDKNQTDWLGRFYVELAEIMHAEGFKLCAFNFAPGEPEPAHWQTPGMLAYLQLCADRPYDTAVGLHEYALGDNLQAAYPHLIGRFEALHQVFDDRGARRPSILITEWGWRQESVPTDAMAQLPFAAGLYAQHLNIIGAGLWTLQNWSSGCIPNCVQALISPMTQYSLTAVFPDAPPVDPPDPPGDKPKIVIVKKPQKAEMTLAENQAVGEWGWNNYGRTTAHSPDDMFTMLAAGNFESYVVIPYPDRQADDIAAIEAAGYRWQPMDGNPLVGLQLGYLFNYRYQMTSPFNSPRSYGLHEGADYDLVGGPVNNKEMVLCAYPGTVDRSLDSSGGYGKYVRVAHVRFGKTFYTRYCHLDSRAVAVGQELSQGQPVGEIGTTGNVTGEHVHFNLEVPGYGLPGYVVADVVDPAPYLPNPSSLPPLPTGQNIDMSVYFYPANNVTHSDIFTLSNNWGEGPERCQLQRAGNVSYVTKNQQYEKRTVGNVTIALNLDTSPGNGEYYTVESPTGWMPRMWQPGQSFTRQEITRVYRKSDCAFLRQSNWATPLTFERIHPTWTSQAGIALQNVAELSWFANGRVDERYWYAPGLGLVAWEKYDGKRSWISELIPRGNQHDNVRETGCF